MMAIDTTASTAPAAKAWAVPTSSGLALGEDRAPSTVAAASAMPIAAASKPTAKRREPPTTMIGCAAP